MVSREEIVVVYEVGEAPPSVTWMSKVMGSVREKMRARGYLKRIERFM